MKVLVLGATGVAGRASLPLLVGAGHETLAHVRSVEKAALVAATGAVPVMGDATDPARLRRWLAGRDAVIDLRVSIPRASRAALPWTWRAYARLRDRALGQVVDAALSVGVPRVIRDTATMVYRDGADTWLDEAWSVDATGSLGANLAAERHLARLTSAGGTGVALRCSGFYGPDDEFSLEMMRAVRAGRALLAGDPEGYSSAVHTRDVGTAILTSLTAPAGIYNVSDDEPLRRSELLRIMASAAGRPSVRAYPAWAARMASAPIRALGRSHRVSSGRLQALGWRPGVPSRRTGWPEAFARTIGR